MAKKNKKLGRRSLALLLVLVMAFSLFQITALAANMECGLPEHTHSEECYETRTHEHGDESSDCYSDHQHSGMCNSVNHVHSTDTCAYTIHEHGDDCNTAHRHNDDCYGLTCTAEEHKHGRNCGKNCQIEQHSHSERGGCYGVTCSVEDGTLEQSCGYEGGETVYSCTTQYEYPNCPARDYVCELEEGENTVKICGLEEHTHGKDCYPSGTYTFDHIDIRVKASDYHLVLGSNSYDLTIAFSADPADTFSVTVPTGGKADDGKTHTVSPSGYQNQEGEFRLLKLELSDYHQPSEFRISGTVLVLKSQVDALPEVLRAEFENLPTATYTAAQVYSASSNDGGEYYRLTLNNYVPSANVCIGWGNNKGYDFNITPAAILTPVTDFVVVNKVVVNEAGEAINDDQSFNFTLSNLNGQVGQPISLKGGESGSFTNLTSGLYSVTETAVNGYKPVAFNGAGWDDALYVQEVQSVSKVDGTAGTVTFYNMKLVDKGSLKVSKSVTGTAAASYTGGSYSFEVKDASGETVATFSLANGQSTEIIVPAGNYTVIETGAEVDGTDTLTVSANGDEIDVSGGTYSTDVTVPKAGTASVAFVNNYDSYVEPPAPTTGSLTITKVFAGDEVDVPENMGFTVTGEGYAETVAYSEFANGAYTIEDLAPGSYTVAESGADVDGYTLEVTGDVSAEVTAGATAGITVVNTYTEELPPSPSAPVTGNLTITKVFEGDEVEAPENLAFEVSGVGEINFHESYYYSEFVDGSYTIEDLAPGSYTVFERNAGVDGYKLTVSGEGAATVVAGETADITVTNTYDYIEVITPPVVIPTGSLIITKTFEGDSVEAPEGMGFTVSGPGYSRTFAYSEFANGIYTLRGLFPGSYTVTEFGADVEGYELTVSGEGTVTVTTGGAANVVITNTYEESIIDIPDEEPPLADLPDEEPPLADLPDEEPPLADIPDEAPPLSDVPKTGDMSAIWYVLTALSGSGLAALAVTGKKREE